MSAMQKLKAGHVARIRVNPTDCISTLDLLDAVGIKYDNGMSFAQCVSLAFSSLLETARQNNMLPTPTGFEFLTRMAPFEGHASQKRKLDITNTITGIGGKFHAPVLEAEDIPADPQPPAAGVSTEVRLAGRELGELCRKKELAGMPGSGIVWSASDQEDYERCYRIVYPGERVA